MSKKFSDSKEAYQWFKEWIKGKDLSISDERNIAVSAGRRTVFQQQIWTNSNEVYHFKYWTSKWIPDDSKNIRKEHARLMDERLKFVLKNFGNEDLSASGLNLETMLDLLDLAIKGYNTYLITCYASGEIYWAEMLNLYNFCTTYGLIPPYKTTYGEIFVWIPTGWLSPISSPRISLPELTP